MGKVVLLTGPPGVGKSTLRSALSRRVPGLQAFDYGKLLLERKAAEGVKIEYQELREKSSGLISPADVESVDNWVIERISEMRQQSNIVLDSHALTAESYGFRAVPFSAGQLQKLKFDAVLALRSDPALLLQRTQQRPDGRRDVPEDLMRELQILQESVGISYAIACGCPIFFIDTTKRGQEEVAEVAMAVLATVGLRGSARAD